MEDRDYMRIALEEADRAAKRGEVPTGGQDCRLQPLGQSSALSSFAQFILDQAKEACGNRRTGEQYR